MFSVGMPSSWASTSAAAAEGAEADHRAGAVLGLPGGPQPGHGGRFPRPGRADQHVEDPSRSSDLLDGHGLVEAQPVTAAREVRVGHGGHRGHRDGRAGAVPSRLEQPGLGVEQGLGGVRQPALGPQARGAVGALVAAGDVGLDAGPGPPTVPWPGPSPARPRPRARRGRQSGHRGGAGGPRPAGSCG